MAAKKLTPREQKFVDKYFLSLFNGAEAARKMGYKDVSARSVAYKFLKKRHVKRAIEARRLAESARDAQLAKLTKTTTAFRANPNITSLVTWNKEGMSLIPSDQLSLEAGYQISRLKITKRTRSGLTEEGRAWEEVEITQEVALHDPNRAADQIHKLFGHYQASDLGGLIIDLGAEIRAADARRKEAEVAHFEGEEPGKRPSWGWEGEGTDVKNGED